MLGAEPMEHGIPIPAGQGHPWRTKPSLQDEPSQPACLPVQGQPHAGISKQMNKQPRPCFPGLCSSSPGFSFPGRTQPALPGPRQAREVDGPCGTCGQLLSSSGEDSKSCIFQILMISDSVSAHVIKLPLQSEHAQKSPFHCSLHCSHFTENLPAPGRPLERDYPGHPGDAPVMQIICQLSDRAPGLKTDHSPEKKRKLFKPECCLVAFKSSTCP